MPSNSFWSAILMQPIGIIIRCLPCDANGAAKPGVGHVPVPRPHFQGVSRLDRTT